MGVITLDDDIERVVSQRTPHLLIVLRPSRGVPVVAPRNSDRAVAADGQRPTSDGALFRAAVAGLSELTLSPPSLLWAAVARILVDVELSIGE